MSDLVEKYPAAIWWEVYFLACLSYVNIYLMSDENP